MKKVEREGELIIYSIEADNSNLTIETARSTFYKFDSALSSKNSSYQYFALKIKFNTPQGGEHIWLSQISKEGKRFFGIVDNAPNSIIKIGIGEKIEIDQARISDWMYLENGNVFRGGYTIRVLRDKMSDEEREKFDKENGLVF